jgi:hypothetical protein
VAHLAASRAGPSNSSEKANFILEAGLAALKAMADRQRAKIDFMMGKKIISRP